MFELRRIACAKDLENNGQGPRVSSPTPGAARRVPSSLYSYVSALWEDSVEVGQHGEHGSAAGPLPHTHDIAFGVHLDIGETMGPEHSRYALARASSLNGGAGISVRWMSSFANRSWPDRNDCVAIRNLSLCRMVRTRVCGSSAASSAVQAAHTRIAIVQGCIIALA
jgi:hypothetical protein